MSSYYEKILATGEVKCIDEEVPFEIPQGWEWCRVSSLFQINPKVVAEDNTSAAFIPMEAISAGYGSEFRYYEKEWGEIKSGYTAFADNDIAFAKITPCFQNRKSAIFEGLPNGIGAGTTELKILRTYGETINRWFVLYFLESPYFIDEATFKGTANQQRIIVGYLENKLFPLPPLAEQERIVDKIGLVMPIIDKYSKSQELLDKMNVELNECLKKSVLQEAIQGKLVPQIAEEGTAHELLEQIKAEKQKLVKEGKLKKSALASSVIFRGDDNKYWEKSGDNIVCIDEEIPFGIPSSWSWCRLGNIASVKGGKRIPVGEKLTTENTGHMYIRVADMKENTVKTDDIHYISESIYQKIKSYTISTEDLYITVAGTIGSVGEIPKVFDNANLTENADKIVFKGICKKFLMYCLLSNFVQSQIKKCTTKVGQPKLAIVRIEDLVIPLPPIKEQYRIVHKIEQTASIMSR